MQKKLSTLTLLKVKQYAIYRAFFGRKITSM